jgi:hypothetical protein
MSHKFGFPSMTNKASNNKAKGGNSSKASNEEFIVRVSDINLDPSTGFTKIGVINGERVNSKGILTGKIYSDIRPADPYKKSFPLVNEYVRVKYVIAPNTIGGQFVYEGPLSLYGAVSPNVNPNPTPLVNPTPVSQKLNYSQVESGGYNVQNNNLVSLDFNSISNPGQATFVERSNIHPLLPYAGDIIHEGRWGNSLRFGSTAKVTGNYPNSWSSFGNNGDPITILINGQNPKSSNFGAEPLIENISQDLSSIYLTSYQKIPFSLANENFISYTTPPTTPAQYANPQVVLNSDRVVINAKNDSVLISGQTSVGISSNGSVNIESTGEINIASKLTRLGNKNANQSVLRGDETVAYLKILITELQNISEALKVIQDWPGGAPSPNPVVLTAANSALQVFENVYNEIDSVKSKIVKTI